MGKGPFLAGGLFAKGPNLELDVVRCNFTNNFAIHQAGGLMVSGSRRPGIIVAKIEDTLFNGNGALWGGGMHAMVSIVRSRRFSCFQYGPGIR